MFASDQTEDSITMIEKENDELFLDLIKERPCLYKKDSNDYRDKILLENAMEDIAFIMQDSVANCEKKWQLFKQAYTREKSLQEQESRSGAGASTRRKWIHYKKMKELFSVDSSRHSYNNLSNTNDKENPNQKLTLPQRWKNKRKTVNPVEFALNNIEASMSRVFQAMADENVDSVDTLIGKIIKARLDQGDPSIAKKKRKLITKCLIDTDSESD